ncbi:MAG: DNA polymerase I [Planctomycetes bacterium]|jgi:DNA polymerase-1|nr:DNA polymerase I [Planctomycetota bacterium]
MPQPTETPTQTGSPTLYLIDGHAQMFRAFFAIRGGTSGGMTSPVTGEPTNALFAFTGMLIKMFKACSPDYAAMVVDAEGKTFRDEFYPEYKATRDEPPEDFVKQIPRMFELAQLFGLPILEKPGYEADDIMATLATRVDAGDFDAAAPGIKLRLVAKDKDLEQVISDRVVLYDVQTDELLDAERLYEKRGITHEQVIDYQTLIGDSTDNIPGVKGIGPKTAAKLIDQFGSVDDLIKNLDQLKGKQKENLETARDEGLIELSRKLVTLQTQTPIDFDLDATRTRGLAKIDGPALLELFRTLGFNRHVADLRDLLGIKDEALTAKSVKAAKTDSMKSKPEAGAGGLFGGGDAAEEPESNSMVAGEPAGDYHAVTTKKQLQELIKTLRQQELIAIDTETIGLGRRAALAGVCLSWREGAGVYIPTRSPTAEDHLDAPTVIEALRPLLEDPDRPKCGHHLKYDLHVLRSAGVEMRGIAFDSMIGAFLAGAPGIGMDDLALSVLDYRCTPITELIGPKPSRKSDPPQKTIDQVALDRVTPYAAEDADITLRLCRHFQSKLDELGMAELAAEVEMPLIEVLTTMEAHGITCDPEELDRQRDKLQQRIDALRTDILNAAQVDFNPDSPKQLADVLFNQLGFPSIKKTKTGYSTDVEVMEKLAERAGAGELDQVADHAIGIPALILEYRMLTKLVGTYLGNLKDAIDPVSGGGDGRVHTTFVQTGAATGRLASNNPNLQNIPIRTEIGRRIRKAFIAPPGRVLLSADYSQIELRMLAHLSGDENLTAAFNEGQDIHTAVAAQVFDTPPAEVSSEQRGHAKTINFGIIYGVTAFGLARRIEGLDNEGAAQLIADYKARFPGIDRFLDQCVEHAKEHGYVTTILGRRRAIPEVTSRNGQTRQLGERLAINSVVQGSAADLIKLAMVNLHRRIRDDGLPLKMLLQIHDELVCEAPETDAGAMSAIMRETMEGAMELSVPLAVECGIGGSWFETK